MEEKTLPHKIVRNTIFNIIGRVWSILIALILTPYIIRHIGVDRFGVWAIVGVLTGYFGLLDFGISSSFVKYISEFYTKNEHAKINQLVNTGFLFYSAFTVIAVALGFIFINPIVQILNIPPELHSEARFVILVGIAIFGVANSLSAFRAAQDGLQRMDIANKIAIAVSVPQVIGTIFFLESGYGLPGLIINNAIILVISSVANIIVAFKILPQLKFNLFLFDYEIFRKLFNFGYKIQIARLSSITSVHIDKILISYFLSIGLVTYFQLGSYIVEGVKILPLLFMSALIPAFSEIDARGQKAKLIEGNIRGTKKQALVATPLFAFTIISAPQIMLAWMGPGYEKSVGIIQILCIGWLCAVLSGMRSVIVQAIGKPSMEMKAGLIMLILNIPLSLVFIFRYGYMGVAIGTTLSLLIAAIYILVEFNRQIQVSMKYFVKETTIIKTIIICVCISTPFGIADIIYQDVFLSSSRTMNIISLIIRFLLFSITYLTILFYSKPLDKIDTRLFKGNLSFVTPLIAKLSSEKLQDTDKITTR